MKRGSWGHIIGAAFAWALLITFALTVMASTPPARVMAQNTSEFKLVTHPEPKIGDIVAAPVPLNLELLEVVPIENGGNIVPRGYSRFHDPASGAEILCFRDSANFAKASISCVPTGRNWH